MITIILPELLVYIFTVAIVISVVLDVYRIYLNRQLDKEVERANKLTQDE